jgi:hypothetical protein
MSSYLFNIVIALVFIYEAFILFTKKNGGSDRNFEKYTEESLAKFSPIGGVVLLLAAVYEIIEILHRTGIAQFLPLDEDGRIPVYIHVPVLLGIVALYLILYFTMLKKKDDYVDPKKGGDSIKPGKSDEDEEY